MTRDRGEKRKIDFTHALRKRKKAEIIDRNNDCPYYGNLHQYSKNKIHCSCPDCSAKTARDGYTNTDKKKLLNFEEQLNEEE